MLRSHAELRSRLRTPTLPCKPGLTHFALYPTLCIEFMISQGSSDSKGQLGVKCVSGLQTLVSG